MASQENFAGFGSYFYAISQLLSSCGETALLVSEELSRSTRTLAANEQVKSTCAPSCVDATVCSSHLETGRVRFDQQAPVEATSVLVASYSFSACCSVVWRSRIFFMGRKCEFELNQRQETHTSLRTAVCASSPQRHWIECILGILRQSGHPMLSSLYPVAFAQKCQPNGYPRLGRRGEAEAEKAK